MYDMRLLLVRARTEEIERAGRRHAEQQYLTVRSKGLGWYVKDPPEVRRVRMRK